MEAQRERRCLVIQRVKERKKEDDDSTQYHKKKLCTSDQRLKIFKDSLIRSKVFGEEMSKSKHAQGV